MDIQPLTIPDIKLLTPVRHGDERGFFSEIYSEQAMTDAGLSLNFVQENYSLSAVPHTVRGLHMQAPPFAQTKLVQVVSGAIIDVAVDIRRGSPWYGQFVMVELSAANWQQLLVPAGFAHGFCTTAPDTAVIYKVTAPYSPEHDGGILWNDPELGIPWPADATTALLSTKDQKLPLLKDFASPFTYNERS